jgi:hypothetical protein
MGHMTTTTIATDPRTGQPYEDEYGDPIECLDDHGDGTCRGEIDYRMALSGTDHHWDRRLVEQERIDRTYGPDSDVPPSWFKAGLGGTNEYGERWDDND